MALPDRLPVMLAPARAIVDAVSLRLSLMAPRRSMWLPLALRLPVSPPTLPSPILGLFLVSATDVVSAEKIALWNNISEQKHGISYSKKSALDRPFFSNRSHLDSQKSQEKGTIL